MVNPTDKDDKHTAKRLRSELSVTESSESTASDIISLLKGLNSKIDVLTATVLGNSTAIKDIDAKLTEKIDNLESSVTANINAIKVEVESRITDFTADFNQRLNDLAVATQSSCQENTKLIQDSNRKLDNIQQDTESRFNKLEREILRNELIVTGVPAVYGENVMDIISNICKALQCNVNVKDVVAAYRLPARKSKSGRVRNERSSGPIILKLVNDWGKEAFVSAYFKKRNLNTGDIGYQSKSRIYVNESLTIHNRAIFETATEAKKAKLITKCYTRNGIVHIQMSEEGRIFRIYDIDQLNAIISPNSNPQNSGSSPNSSNQNENPITTEPTTVLQTQLTTKPDITTAMHDGETMEG